MSQMQRQAQIMIPNTSAGSWAKARCQLCGAEAPTNPAGDPPLLNASWASCWRPCSWQLCQCKAPLSVH